MLYNEREEIICQQLQIQSTMTIQDLSDLLNVSIDTVRRDLKNMDKKGLLKYVRGGARTNDSFVGNFERREVINSLLKREACRKAIKLIKKGDIIALNSGTTNTILAQEIVASKEDIVVVTNNIMATNILMQSDKIKVIFIGGEVDNLECSTYGKNCENEFMQYYPDICFLSINAINYKNGYTDFRISEKAIIQLLAQQSKQVVAVMDSTKLGKCSKYKVLDLEEVDYLIMDNEVKDEVKEKYFRKGIIIE